MRLAERLALRLSVWACSVAAWGLFCHAVSPHVIVAFLGGVVIGNLVMCWALMGAFEL